MTSPVDQAALPRRPALVWLLLASAVVAGFSLVTTGLWIPAVMMFDAPGSTQSPPTVAFALYSAAGPLAGLAGIATGWIRIAQGRRFSGLKWMIVLPIVWLVGLLGWFAVLAAFCGGQFDCRV